MALLKILQYPDERLHTVADRVSEVTDEIRALVRDMADTMYAAPGIGLAATQVDVHERFMVIDVSETRDQPLVFINPVICRRTEQLREQTDTFFAYGVSLVIYFVIAYILTLIMNALEVRAKHRLGRGESLREALTPKTPETAAAEGGRKV